MSDAPCLAATSQILLASLDAASSTALTAALSSPAQPARTASSHVLFFDTWVPRWVGRLDADTPFFSTASSPPLVVPTRAATRNAQLLARTLVASRASSARGRPLLVEGPPGAGKTLLLRALAAAAGAPPLLEVHLDDASDGRELLGATVCGDVPGAFSWVPGAITRAAEDGRWVLVEDIDRAPFDVLASLAPLLECRALPLPGQPHAARVHADFQLFATRRTQARRPTAPAAGPLAAFSSLFVGISFVSGDDEEDAAASDGSAAAGSAAPFFSFSSGGVAAPVSAPSTAAPAAPELLQLLAQRHPRFPADVISSLYATFEGVRWAVSGSTSTLPAGALPLAVNVAAALRPLSRDGRALSKNDALRWALRVERLTPLVQRVAAMGGAAVYLTDAERSVIARIGADVIAAHAPSPAVHAAVLRAISSGLGLGAGIPDEADEADADGGGVAYAAQLNGALSLSVCGVTLRVSDERAIAVARAGIASSPALPASFVPTRTALRAMRTLACTIASDEPALLVGETGAGKTSLVAALAHAAGATLHVVNLNAQSDSADLLGGFKPLRLRQIALPILARFEALRVADSATGASVIAALRAALAQEAWPRFIGGLVKAGRAAISRCGSEQAAPWITLANDVAAFERQFVASGAAAQGASSAGADADAGAGGAVDAGSIGGAAFAFQEGVLPMALRTGAWILLDEINLASAETLQRLAGLLEGGSITLTERGDSVPIPRSRDFRLLAAMNPATDAGKRDLPPALRARFAEQWVPETVAPRDLTAIVSRFVRSWPLGVGNPLRVEEIVSAIVEAFIAARALAAPITGTLRDGAGVRPRYSLRSLTRALSGAGALVRGGLPILRALREGLELAFFTQLAAPSAEKLRAALAEHLDPLVSTGSRALKRARGAVSSASFFGGAVDGDDAHPPARPADAPRALLVEGFWLTPGPLPPYDPASPLPSEDGASSAPAYVLVPSARARARALARAVAAGPVPVLLEGPTSAGKTSLVEYLAARTGHAVVRINNHEHTDVAEYLGAYVPAGPGGRLVFADGLLVRALREGAWLILDELNLAPSDVLEALNRLLDDNQELFVPETQETVRPAPGFALFATQNPAGVYGGRKVLSAALRNRFVEVAVEDLSPPELVEILTRRARLPASFAKGMVDVGADLARLRATSDVFAGARGLVTPRDLLRWAARGPRTWEAIAADGFFLLAERLRTAREVDAVRDTLAARLHGNLRNKADVEALYAEPFAGAPAVASPTKRARVDDGDSSTAFSIASSLPPPPIPVLPEVHAVGSRATAAALDVDDAESAAFSAALTERLRFFLSLLGATDEERGNLAPGAVPGTEGLRALTLTRSLRRLFTLLARCVAADEPALLVGATGTGKTTVVQLLALLCGAPLAVLNAHAHTETADFLGSQRPCRRPNAVAAGGGFAESGAAGASPLFEWEDGPLVTALKTGSFFLFDEISLAEDAVLERLNSVLEPARTLTLAERAGGAAAAAATVRAARGFRFFATMNPSGDFGKRDLSPALRNRFTEIWVPPMTAGDGDVALIISAKAAEAASRAGLVASIRVSRVLGDAAAQQKHALSPIAAPLEQFLEWAHSGGVADSRRSFALTLRDIEAWLRFVASVLGEGVRERADAGVAPLQLWEAFAHGAALVLLDGLGLGTSLSLAAARAARAGAVEQLLLVSPAAERDAMRVVFSAGDVADTGAVDDDGSDDEESRLSIGTAPAVLNGYFGVAPFFIPLGPSPLSPTSSYELSAPTTRLNLLRVLRGLQLSLPVLLEGPPGVGKTTLVEALARASGHTLVRINLSEQTDIADLFGADLPAPGGGFAWRDGVFLSALKAGSWVLLDELNLAPQPVLEGLNGVLDHRRVAYVPALGRSFAAPPAFRVFAAQNPLAQGGGRKGLPASFLNRFVKVSVAPLRARDLRVALHALFPALGRAPVRTMVRTARSLGALARSGALGVDAPQDFNLRDLLRWGELMGDGRGAPLGAELETAVLSRLRAPAERAAAAAAFFAAAGGRAGFRPRDAPLVRATKDWFSIDDAVLPRARVLGAWTPATVDVSAGASVALRAALGAPATVGATGADAAFHEAADEAAVSAAAALPAPLRRAAYAAARAVALSAPVLLVGPPSSGKTAVVHALAALAGARLRTVTLTPAADATELVGCFEQASGARERAGAEEEVEGVAIGLIAAALEWGWSGAEIGLLRCALTARHAAVAAAAPRASPTAATRVENVAAAARALICALNEPGALPARSAQLEIALAVLDAASRRAADAEARAAAPNAARGAFTWADGDLVVALERGEWILLEHVNACAPAVLDRLNALLEPGGALAIHEAGVGADGSPRCVRSHPASRIFLSMTPALGQVSRALRNRCIEVALAERSVSGGTDGDVVAVSAARRALVLTALPPTLLPTPVVAPLTPKLAAPLDEREQNSPADDSTDASATSASEADSDSPVEDSATGIAHIATSAAQCFASTAVPRIVDYLRAACAAGLSSAESALSLATLHSRARPRKLVHAAELAAGWLRAGASPATDELAGLPAAAPDALSGALALALAAPSNPRARDTFSVLAAPATPPDAANARVAADAWSVAAVTAVFRGSSADASDVDAVSAAVDAALTTAGTGSVGAVARLVAARGAARELATALRASTAARAHADAMGMLAQVLPTTVPFLTLATHSRASSGLWCAIRERVFGAEGDTRVHAVAAWDVLCEARRVLRRTLRAAASAGANDAVMIATLAAARDAFTRAASGARDETISLQAAALASIVHDDDAASSILPPELRKAAEALAVLVPARVLLAVPGVAAAIRADMLSRIVHAKSPAAASSAAARVALQSADAASALAERIRIRIVPGSSGSGPALDSAHISLADGVVGENCEADADDEGVMRASPRTTATLRARMELCIERLARAVTALGVSGATGTAASSRLAGRVRAERVWLALGHPRAARSRAAYEAASALRTLAAELSATSAEAPAATVPDLQYAPTADAPADALSALTLLPGQLRRRVAGALGALGVAGSGAANSDASGLTQLATDASEMLRAHVAERRVAGAGGDADEGDAEGAAIDEHNRLGVSAALLRRLCVSPAAASLARRSLRVAAASPVAQSIARILLAREIALLHVLRVAAVRAALAAQPFAPAPNVARAARVALRAAAAAGAWPLNTLATLQQVAWAVSAAATAPAAAAEAFAEVSSSWEASLFARADAAFDIGGISALPVDALVDAPCELGEYDARVVSLAVVGATLAAAQPVAADAYAVRRVGADFESMSLVATDPVLSAAYVCAAFTANASVEAPAHAHDIRATLGDWFSGLSTDANAGEDVKAGANARLAKVVAAAQSLFGSDGESESTQAVWGSAAIEAADAAARTPSPHASARAALLAHALRFALLAPAVTGDVDPAVSPLLRAANASARSAAAAGFVELDVAAAALHGSAAAAKRAARAGAALLTRGARSAVLAARAAYRPAPGPPDARTAAAFPRGIPAFADVSAAVRGFRDAFVTRTAVGAVVDALSPGADARAHAAARHWADAVRGFADSLAYFSSTGFADVASPLEACARAMAIAVRWGLLPHGSGAREHAQVDDAHPSESFLSAELALSRGIDSARTHARAALSAVADVAAANADAARAARVAQDAARSGTVSGETAEEIAEREFNEWIPRIPGFDALAGVGAAGPAGAGPSEKKKAVAPPPSRLLTKSATKTADPAALTNDALVAAYTRAWTTASSGESPWLTRAGGAGVQRSARWAARSVGGSAIRAPIRAAHSLATLLDTTPAASRDYYSASAPAEGAAAVRPLRALAARAAELLAQFPGHEGLSLLLRVVGACAALRVDAPLPALVAGAALVLEKSREWDSSAPAALSLGAPRAALSALVGRWRALELAAWPALLDAEDARSRVERNAEEFFALRAVVLDTDTGAGANAGVEGAGADEGVDAGGRFARELLPALAPAPHLVHAAARASAWALPGAPRSSTEAAVCDARTTAVVSAVDGFLRSAPLGAFEARLDLVRAVAAEAAARATAARSGPLADALFTSAMAARGIRNFYLQFSAPVRVALAALVEPARRALAEQVRLHRWDEQSHYAAAAAAERAHRLVFRAIRDYRVLVDTPARATIDAANAPSTHQLSGTDAGASGDAADGSATSKDGTAGSPARTAANGVLTLLRTATPEAVAARAAELLTTSPRAPLSARAFEKRADDARAVADLADEFVDTARAMAAPHTPRAQQRRALVTALQTLARAGASALAIALPREHFDATRAAAVLAQSPVDAGGVCVGVHAVLGAQSMSAALAVSAALTRASLDHVRAVDSVARLRSATAAGAIHADLPATTARKALALVDHLVSANTGARAALAAGDALLSRAAAAARRLRALSSLSDDAPRAARACDGVAAARVLSALEAAGERAREAAGAATSARTLLRALARTLTGEAARATPWAVENAADEAALVGLRGGAALPAALASRMAVAKNVEAALTELSVQIDAAIDGLTRGVRVGHGAGELIILDDAWGPAISSAGAAADAALDAAEHGVGGPDGVAAVNDDDDGEDDDDDDDAPAAPPLLGGLLADCCARGRDALILLRDARIADFAYGSSCGDAQPIAAPSADAAFDAARRAFQLAVQSLAAPTVALWGVADSDEPIGCGSDGDDEAAAAAADAVHYPNIPNVIERATGSLVSCRVSSLVDAASAIESAATALVGRGVASGRLGAPDAKRAASVAQFVEAVALAQAALFSDFATLHSASARLALVSVSSLRSLAESGFCGDGGKVAENDGKGTEAGDAPPPPGADGRFQTGTGIGEGAGQTDVSEQIENEEQVLGLAGADDGGAGAGADEKGEQRPDTGTGVELDADFDGDEFSLPPPDDGAAADDENDGKEDAGEEEQLDRTMGAADDANAKVIDEKLWEPPAPGADTKRPAPARANDAVQGAEKSAGTRAADKNAAEEGGAAEDGGDDADEDADAAGGVDDADGDDAKPADAREPEASEAALPSRGKMATETADDAPAEGGGDLPEDDERARGDAEGADDGGEGEDEVDPNGDGAIGEDEDAGNGDGGVDEEADADGVDGADGGAPPDSAAAPPLAADEVDADLPARMQIDGDESDTDEAANIAGDDAAGAMPPDATPDDAANGAEADDTNPPPPSKADPQARAPAETVAPGVAAAGGADRVAGSGAAHGAPEGGDDAPPPPPGDDDIGALTDVAEAGATDEAPHGAAGTGDDTGAGDEAPAGGAWRAAPLAQKAGEKERGRRSRNDTAARRDAANPLTDPAAALRHWQARMRDAQTEESTTAAREDEVDGGGEDEPSQNGALANSRDVDVVLSKSGGVDMLAPFATQEGDDEGDADGALPPDDAVGADEKSGVGSDDDSEVEQGMRVDDDGASSDGDARPLVAGAAQPRRKNAVATEPAAPSRARDGADDAADDSAPAPIDAMLEDLADGLNVSALENLLPSTLAALGLPPTAAPPQDDDGMGVSSVELVDVSPAALRAGYDAAFSTWAAGGDGAARAALASAAWSALSAVANEPASRLCEGLRLVLEPTLASRLGGDFRTGKRLNMRRIIPYIASSFKKDKIFQRRTKPSARTYEILVAIDDSRSMGGAMGGRAPVSSAPATGGARPSVPSPATSGGAMACEALAVVAGALAKLEVGRVGVLSFGRDVRLLHALDAPWSDDAGARVVNGFTFAQDATRVDAVLEAAVRVLGETRAAAGARTTAASHSGNAKVAQLLFVLSDGLVGSGAERERIRAWITEAQRVGVLVVLIVLDRDAGESITEMASVAFSGDQVVRSAYLDNYPFPFYIIVRDTRTLPEVLADAVRQWFEMNAASV